MGNVSVTTALVFLLDNPDSLFFPNTKKPGRFNCRASEKTMDQEKLPSERVITRLQG